MNLSVGIVGLPNVGKSTLFNALLKKQVAEASNYPFTTIEPNVGVVEVPDERLPVLAKLSNSQKIVPAAVKFVDIAGLVKNAHKGEGLGNQFLATIREVDAIVHVVRDFSNLDVVQTGESPESDIETIETELQLADLQTVENAEGKTQKAKDQVKGQKERVEKLYQGLSSGLSARDIQLSDEERLATSDLHLLTSKPKIIVYNIDEDRVREFANETGDTLHISAKIEAEIASMPDDEAKEFMETYGLTESGLSKLIKKGYEVLGLISFLTTGEKETRAWTLRRGETSLRASAVIHTDFAKKFIKADVIPYQDFVELGGWKQARDVGKVRIEGRDYIMQDGDVVEFKIGA